MDTYCTWITRELDKTLAGMRTDRERRLLLDTFADRWRDLYRRFIAGDSFKPHPKFGLPNAADFVVVIGAIDQRRAALLRAKEDAC